MAVLLPFRFISLLLRGQENVHMQFLAYFFMLTYSSVEQSILPVQAAIQEQFLQFLYQYLPQFHTLSSHLSNF
ncbi:hypothetical protein L1987_04812 [Smallanthus sonchifolius]|uniref:Uncharacterized protein n=1 Tax=Smallanthus sonchifolius TaxID=185202 RepID=A0ACB9JTL3_9ASTR|nr:hypothetical protein L1987_04812 [Smallanthus sonchifolius]